VSDDIERIEVAVAATLPDKPTDRETIINRVTMIASLPEFSRTVTDEEIQIITKRLEARFDVSMGLGSLLKAEDHTPWLDERRGDIDWYYWKRYKMQLREKKFADPVISGLDIVTNKILDHLEDPSKEGTWKRKGLVVGHVQSGKTANYSGVICKAADAGYKVIIVLAGLLNALRNQTQDRIDEGFIGFDSSRQLENITPVEKIIGVGQFDHSRNPFSLTTNMHDFNKQFASQLRARIGDFHEPVVLVLKKNVSILKNLIEWLKSNNLELNNVPMLLIDDEADHASVDTSKGDDDPTATNSRIRELLALFEQNSYLGYTATPFANIFIDPENEDEMLNDDLFPRDFIISLDAPSNYVGAKRIFEDDGDLDIVREIDDYEDILPLKHKIYEQPEILPPSLYSAVRAFILAKAARNLREQDKAHHSMLVNVSRFTGIQTHIKLLIHDYVTEVRDAIISHYALPIADALKNSDMRALNQSWIDEFNTTEFQWKDIQGELKSAVSAVRVIEINGATTSEPLDYNKRDYPNGRSVIAVGGLSLSRGLTLEGLTVSYFLRNSIMYDTLMQMGRWFGYRTDFEDLCRIYMTEEASSWYGHISRVIEELRDEFSRMEKAKMTPRDFGLCVRSHPETLIVTARNKMRTARKVPRQISLEGRLVESSILFKTKQAVEHNFNALELLINNIADKVTNPVGSPGFLFENIHYSDITRFVDSFINHPASQLTESKPIIDYIEWLAEQGVDGWDVVLISLSKKAAGNLHRKVGNHNVVCQQRTVGDNFPGKGIELNKRRLASRGHETAGISKHDIQTAESAYLIDNPGKKNFPDSIYRAMRTKPLLMLHVLDCRKKTNETESVDSSLFPDGIVAYGISFPGEAGTRRPKKLVEYMVNTVWWNSNYADLLDEDDE